MSCTLFPVASWDVLCSFDGKRRVLALGECTSPFSKTVGSRNGLYPVNIDQWGFLLLEQVLSTSLRLKHVTGSVLSMSLDVLYSLHGFIVGISMHFSEKSKNSLCAPPLIIHKRSLYCRTGLLSSSSFQTILFQSYLDCQINWVL